MKRSESPTSQCFGTRYRCGNVAGALLLALIQVGCGSGISLDPNSNPVPQPDADLDASPDSSPMDASFESDTSTDRHASPDRSEADSKDEASDAPSDVVDGSTPDASDTHDQEVDFGCGTSGNATCDASDEPMPDAFTEPGGDAEARDGADSAPEGGDAEARDGADSAPEGGDAEARDEADSALPWRIYDLATDLRSYQACYDGTSMWCLAQATKVSEAGAATVLSDPTPLGVVGAWSAELPWVKTWSAFLQEPPLFLLNTGDRVALIANVILMLPGTAACHPGPVGEYAVATWRSAEAGIVQYDATFTGIDVEYGTTTDVHVLMNRKEVFVAELDGPLSTRSYSGTSQVEAGDRIAFAVGYGSNRTFFSDATGLRAIVRFSPRQSDARD